MASRDDPARPLPDDQVSLGSYRSDAYTLPCDPVEDDVRSEVSHDSFDSYCREEELPSYRVPKEQGVSQPVYEAWIIYYSDSQDAVQKTTFCGLPVCTRYAESSHYVSCITESHAQDDLSAMAQSAIQGYQVAHKRSFPSRLLCGRTKSYEADLDARIQKLPRPVQSELDGLLGDREAATGNRFHKREWTVAMMREQYRFRFASAEYQEVKKSAKRFWKKGTKRPSEYFFIIRGGEGRVAADDKGMQTATRHGNPWKRVDDTEQLRKQSTRDIRRYGKNYERLHARPRDRSPSPPPRRVWQESEGTASPQHRLPNPFTGPLPPPPPPGTSPFSPLSPPRPWRNALDPLAMPRTCPYLGSMGRHPPLPPPPPPRMSTSLDEFEGNARPPPQPMNMPMNLPGLTPPSLRPPPVNPFASSRLNALVNREPLFDFDFDAFLRDRAPVLSQYTGSSRASPPPAPRLSNLTTPTTFSRASSASDTGSSVDGTEVSTPADGASLNLLVGEEGQMGGYVPDQ